MQTQVPSIGTLRGTSLLELFVHAHATSFTGTLDLRSPGDHTARLVFSDGQLSKIKTTPSGIYLGGVLYELGHIDSDQMNSTLYEIATRKRPHGEILVARGFVDKRQLQEGLAQQVARKVQGLFSSDASTAFEFAKGIDRLPGYGGADWPLVDVRALAWRGLRDHDHSGLLSRLLGSVRDQRFVIATSTNLGRFGFDEDELSTAECLRVKPMSLAELVKVNVIGAARTELLFSCLLLFRQLERRTASSQTKVQAAMPVLPRSSPSMPAIPSARSSSPSIPGAPPASSPSLPAAPPPGSRTSGVMPKRSESYRAFEAAVAAKYTAAHVAYKRGDLASAETLCREALEARPDELEYQAFAIWLASQSAEGQSAEKTLHAIYELTQVILKRDELHAAHYYRGQLYKRAGDAASAARDFRRVVELNPSNVDALRELRLYAMRTRSGATWRFLDAAKRKGGKG